MTELWYAELCDLFFCQAEVGIRDADVTGVQTCALPILDGILLFMAQRGDLGPGTPQVLADQRRRLITAEATTLTQRTNFTGLQIGRASCRERADDPADADAKNTRSTRATASV